jgi:hypothetical protein
VRNALLILLLTFIASMGLSMLIWHKLLFPDMPPIPSGPTAQQRAFGMHIEPAMARKLEQRLADDVVTGPDLSDTIDNLRDAASANIFVNWRALETVGLDKKSPVPPRKLGGMKLGDAVLQLLADQPSPLACSAEDNVLTISTADDIAKFTLTRVYDVRDLTNVAGQTAALETDIEAIVAPGSWRSSANPRANNSLRSMSGQLIVTAGPVDHHALMVYLNDARRGRIRIDFAKHATMVVGPAMAIALAAIFMQRHLARQHRLSIGLCTRCGYDLRASTDRCPECGLGVSPEPIA